MNFSAESVNHRFITYSDSKTLWRKTPRSLIDDAIRFRLRMEHESSTKLSRTK
jgi:hypothetical protein